MGPRGHTGVRLRWRAVATLMLLAMLACDEKNPEPPDEEKPWIPVGIKVLLDVYPRTEANGHEYCGMLCEQTDKQVFATEPIMGTETECVPWDSPCPQGTKAIGTYHTQRIGPLNEGNPMRPFSPHDLDADEPYDFIAQALTPRAKSKLVVHVYLLERGIQTACQVHPTVICPFPPREQK